MKRLLLALLLALSLGQTMSAHAEALRYGWQAVEGLRLFYREGGRARDDAPTLVLLHGNPMSSIQYEKLMEMLAPHWHVIAMD